MLNSEGPLNPLLDPEEPQRTNSIQNIQHMENRLQDKLDEELISDSEQNQNSDSKGVW